MSNMGSDCFLCSLEGRHSGSSDLVCKLPAYALVVNLDELNLAARDQRVAADDARDVAPHVLTAVIRGNETGAATVPPELDRARAYRA